MPQHLSHMCPRRRQKKEHEKILEEIIVENFLKMEKLPPKSTKPRESQTG